jgi:hypothetical protein
MNQALEVANELTEIGFFRKQGEKDSPVFWFRSCIGQLSISCRDLLSRATVDALIVLRTGTWCS